jgi:Flp pilus assembly protein TadD
MRLHPPPTQALLDRVLSGKSLLGDRAARLSLPEDDIFGITTDMRDFLNMHVPSTESNYYKLQRLTEAMTDESLGWKIDAFKTYTAADTFYHKQGNCLSYAIMVIVLGRELGLELYFNEVHIPPIWDMQTEHTIVLLRHVNVLAKADGKRIILDPDLEEYDSSYPQFTITDIAAKAYYYNNRGADYLNADDMERAFLYFRKALMLQPEQAFLWTNIGVLYFRYGHYQEAEAAFLHALELDSSDITAISNLQFLYMKQGNTELANYYRQEAERSRMKNPYYRYFLAKQLLDDNQPDLALKHIKWSIRRYSKEHRFYFMAAKIYARLGKHDDAEKSLERAAKLTEDYKNQLLYQSKIARLREISKPDSAYP